MTGHHHLDGSALAHLVVPLSNGDRLAECINTGGDTAYWVLRPITGLEEAHAEHGSVEGADHENLGPPPNIYQQRLVAVPLRCCKARRDGQPCRVEVACPGEVCRHHRSVAERAAAAEVIQPPTTRRMREDEA